MSATGVRKAGLAAVVVAIAVWAPFSNSEYWNYQLSLVFVWAIAALGLNLVTGYLGQISLGHGAFFALGAYAVVWGMEDQDWPLLAVLIGALTISFVAGYVVGTPALRLHGPYLAMLTLALGVGVLPVLKQLDGLTGGVTGRPLTQSAGPSWLGTAADQYVYLVALVALVGTFAACWALTRGELGRALRAVRENEAAATALGIDVRHHKQVAFGLSAMFAGLAGAVYAIVVGYVSPNAFGVFLSINLLLAVVIGGAGTLVGPILGAIFIQFLPTAAGEVDQALSGLVYGLFLIAAMLVMPEGVAGLARRLSAVALTVVRWVSRSGQGSAEEERDVNLVDGGGQA